MAARAALMAAARRVPSLSSPASHTQAAKLIPRRGLAGGGGLLPNLSSWPTEDQLLAGPIEPIQMEGRAFCDCLFDWLGPTLLWRLQVFFWGEKGEKGRGGSSAITLEQKNRRTVYISGNKHALYACKSFDRLHAQLISFLFVRN